MNARNASTVPVIADTGASFSSSDFPRTARPRRNPISIASTISSVVPRYTSQSGLSLMSTGAHLREWPPPSSAVCDLVAAPEGHATVTSPGADSLAWRCGLCGCVRRVLGTVAQNARSSTEGTPTGGVGWQDLIQCGTQPTPALMRRRTGSAGHLVRRGLRRLTHAWHPAKQAQPNVAQTLQPVEKLVCGSCSPRHRAIRAQNCDDLAPYRAPGRGLADIRGHDPYVFQQAGSFARHT